MKCRRALFKDVKQQVIPLARKSFQEVDPRVKNAFDIDVNEELYEAMEEGGNYAIFVAEDDTGVIHGYLSLVVNESPHIKGYLQAMLDSIYVDSGFRKPAIVKGLIHEAEKYATEMRCSCMVIGFKAKSPHAKFAKSIGYEPDDVMYTKLLEGVE